MDEWVARSAAQIAERAPGELESLVAVSSPSGDVAGAEAAFAVCAGLLPGAARTQRVACSSAGHAPDLVARVPGTGRRRIVLLGHVDTVVAHGEHRGLVGDGGRLTGSGSVDMKGGVVLALGVLRALAARPEDFAEVALLLVCDEEWRAGDFVHTAAFEGYDACLCFEAGERTAGGDDAVVVRRKAAGTLQVLARGRSAHSGAAPDQGANALLALAAAAQSVAAHHDPGGPLRLTAVPTVMRSGDAFNVVPADGELLCDLRADALESFDTVLGELPAEVGGAALEGALLRRWPGMDARAVTAPMLKQAAGHLGRPRAGTDRGGASDASYMAAAVAITVDGLGPRGGGAHAPHEFVLEDSLRSRAEVALALVLAAISG